MTARMLPKRRSGVRFWLTTSAGSCGGLCTSWPVPTRPGSAAAEDNVTRTWRALSDAVSPSTDRKSRVRTQNALPVGGRTALVHSNPAAFRRPALTQPPSFPGLRPGGARAQAWGRLDGCHVQSDVPPLRSLT